MFDSADISALLVKSCQKTLHLKLIFFLTQPKFGLIWQMFGSIHVYEIYWMHVHIHACTVSSLDEERINEMIVQKLVIRWVNQNFL